MFKLNATLAAALVCPLICLSQVARAQAVYVATEYTPNEGEVNDLGLDQSSNVVLFGGVESFGISDGSDFWLDLVPILNNDYYLFNDGFSSGYGWVYYAYVDNATSGFVIPGERLMQYSGKVQANAATDDGGVQCQPLPYRYPGAGDIFTAVFLDGIQIPEAAGDTSYVTCNGSVSPPVATPQICAVSSLAGGNHNGLGASYVFSQAPPLIDQFCVTPNLTGHGGAISKALDSASVAICGFDVAENGGGIGAFVHEVSGTIYLTVAPSSNPEPVCADCMRFNSQVFEGGDTCEGYNGAGDGGT